MSGPAAAQPRSVPSTLPKVLALGAIVAVGATFVAVYVFHYYLNYNPAGFDVYWPAPRRTALLVHISSGMIALLAGPWQFSRRLRQRYLTLHRWMGRTYLVAVACGSIAAWFLAFTTPYGWAWGFGVSMLAVAWTTTSAMAYYAILRRQIPIHKEWMVRSYVVTFAFVTFRILHDFGPTARLQPEADRAVAAIWACWAVPLLFTEVILQLRRMPRARSLS
jgi:uncharacterized membrane protein